MKALRIVYSLTIISFFLLSGCGDMVEEIHLNEDGSGTYDVHSDMMKGMMEMSMAMAEVMGEEMSTQQLDSMRLAMEDEMWSEFGDGLDSTINIYDELPDSLKGDPQVQRILEKTVMYMRGTRKEGVMNIGMEYRFGSMDELRDFYDDFDKLDQKKGGKNNRSSPFSGAKCLYEFDDQHFSRKTKGRVKWSKEEREGAEMMFSEASYRTELHLPYPVKSVKGNGLVQQDGKLVVFEYPFMDIVNGKENGDFTIHFK